MIGEHVDEGAGAQGAGAQVVGDDPAREQRQAMPPAAHRRRANALGDGDGARVARVLRGVFTARPVAATKVVLMACVA